MLEDRPETSLTLATEAERKSKRSKESRTEGPSQKQSCRKEREWEERARGLPGFSESCPRWRRDTALVLCFLSSSPSQPHVWSTSSQVQPFLCIAYLLHSSHPALPESSPVPRQLSPGKSQALPLGDILVSQIPQDKKEFLSRHLFKVTQYQAGQRSDSSLPDFSR